MNLYVQGMEKEYKRMCRAYNKFLSYKGKIEIQNLSEKEQLEYDKFKTKFVKKIKNFNDRIQKEDFDAL